MLANNNRRVIDRMAKSTLRNNKGRNRIIFLSIVLASFMLFSFFTVGITYFKMQRLQNIRLNGGEYDAIMYGVTEEQREKCENNPDIKRTGILAMSGYIESTEKDGTVEASCIWADPVCWDEIMAPARDWVTGVYPKADNEVMVTKEALEQAAGMDVKLMPYELSEGMERTRQLVESVRPGQKIAVFIGPEGGFEETEVAQAKDAGFEPITLGRRILRTETAGLTVMSWLMYRLEGAGI